MMSLQTLCQRAKPFATAGFIALAIVSSAVVARVSEGPEHPVHIHHETPLVQDIATDESLQYKLFLHRQARLAPAHEGAAR